jgi:hypothetical protein
LKDKRKEDKAGGKHLTLAIGIAMTVVNLAILQGIVQVDKEATKIGIHKTSKKTKGKLRKKRGDHEESQSLAAGIARLRREPEVHPPHRPLLPLVNQAEVCLLIMNAPLVTVIVRTKKDNILKKVGTSKRRREKRVELEQKGPVLKVQANDPLKLLLVNIDFHIA